MYWSSARNNYNRIEAVKYAVRYAEKPNQVYQFFSSYGDGGGDCSNFVSQCLHAGGAPMDYSGISPWWYKRINPNKKNYDKWSLSWSVAHSLYLCLKTRGEKNLAGLQGIEVENLNYLEMGDVIQYENSEGKIYHSVIVTNFMLNEGVIEPLVSQHSFNALNTSYIKPKALKVHLMKIYVK